MKLQQVIDAIDQLSNDDFVALAKQVDAQRSKRAQEIMSQATRQAQLLMSDTLGTKKTRRVASIKYRHPQTGQTWTGQGRQPKWVAEYLAQGGKEKDLMV